MSTLTRTNSHSRKPQYKDYVSFLESYKNAKKDEMNSVVSSDSGVNISLSHSSSNSSLSIASDNSDGFHKNDFKEYLENNRKHYSTNSKQQNQQKATVKTEMFIEIKNPAVANNTKVFEVQNVQSPAEATISVTDAAKMFEQSAHSASSLKPKQSFSKKTSIGEISKKFEDKTQPKEEANKIPAKTTTNISQVSKLFEQGKCQNGTLSKPRNFNAVPKPFQSSTKNTDAANNSAILSPRPSIISPKPLISAPDFPTCVSRPSKAYSDSVDSALSSLSISPSPPQSISPPPACLPPLSPTGLSAPPPPPPPLPPANFASKIIHSKPMPSQNKINKVNSNQSASVKNNSSQNGGLITPNGTLDRNDPRVKKAVYGALRNMYGAYYDQANDYLATLPKNRVKKNNGLDSIINSIASQGGLEKLNGRVNPNAEVE